MKLTEGESHLVETLVKASKLGHLHPVWVEFRRRTKNGEFREDFESWAKYEGWNGDEESRRYYWKEFLRFER